jgi:hypothetical protein
VQGIYNHCHRVSTHLQLINNIIIIYNYVPETNQLQLPLLNVLKFLISTSHSMRAAPNRAVFCSYYYHYHYYHYRHYFKLEVRYSCSLRYGRSVDRILLGGEIFRTRPRRH